MSDTPAVVNKETPIAILFGRDPLGHSEADFDRIIEAYREKRHLFNAGVRTPSAPKLTKAEGEVKKLDLKIDLGDI